MKRITFASGSLITGGAVAAALVEHVATLSPNEASVTIDIPVLEENGTVSQHTIMLGAMIQFEVSDVDGATPEDDEDERFPVPELPEPDLMVAVIPTEFGDEDADNFNEAVADIDNVLDGNS